jgi:DNA-binding transcriptional LysR family regulator
MDRLEAMSVLLTVVEEGSLSAGARKLNAALPTISRKVADLERHLGTQLLIRTARRVELTEAGSAYVAASRRIIEQVEEAEREAAGEYLMPRGELTLTAPVMFGRRHVLPVAAEFLEAHPNITMRIHLADKNISITEEHVHIAVRIGELTDNTFKATRVGSVSRVVCANPRYIEKRGRPTTPGELAQHDTIPIAGFADSQVWNFMHDGTTVAAELKPRMVVNMPEAALDAALAGLGIARLLSYQVADELKAGTLVPLLEDWAPPASPVSLVYPSQGILPLKLRAFLNWTAPRLRARLAPG